MGDAADGIRRRSAAVREMRERTVVDAGKKLKKALVARAKTDSGGDQRLSGLGSRAGRLGVSVRTDRGSRTTTVTVDASPKKMRGPWRWMNEGVPAGTRSRRTRSGRVSYSHPGQPGKGTFDEPVDAEIPKIRAEFRAEFRNAIRTGG